MKTGVESKILYVTPKPWEGPIVPTGSDGAKKTGGFAKSMERIHIPACRSTFCRLTQMLATLFMACFSLSSVSASPSAPGEEAPPRLACRFSAAPIDPRCLNRTGAVIVKGERVFEASGVRFPDTLRVYAIHLDGLPDAASFAITRRGQYLGNKTSTFELFQGDTRFQPARWPEAGFMRDGKPASNGQGVVLPQAVFDKFAKEPNLWIGAYWTQIYAYETSPVRAIIPDQRALIVEPLKAPGVIRAVFPFFIFNAYAAISRPGDYVFDPSTRTVYAAAVSDSDAFEVGIEKTLLEINGARDIHLSGLKLEKALDTALVIKNSENVTIDGCDIRHMGKRAIQIEGGHDVVISHCKIDDVAETAIDVSGGDRKSLTPANHVIKDSEITNFDLEARVIHPAIRMGGVGIRVQDNRIAHSPHTAIMLSGNDHEIRGNEISDVATEADDSGAIYAGRDWTDRGNVIEGNWFHDIGMPNASDAHAAVSRTFVSGIYLDDQESGYEIRSNVFDRVGRPIVIHGGRDNQIVGNAFLRCGESGIWMGHGKDSLLPALEGRLEAVPYNAGIWAARYLSLASIKENRPAEPINNSEADNIAIGCRLFSIRAKTDPGLWPDIGKHSREIPLKPDATGGTLAILQSHGIGCGRFPVLCRWSRSQPEGAKTDKIAPQK